MNSGMRRMESSRVQSSMQAAQYSSYNANGHQGQYLSPAQQDPLATLPNMQSQPQYGAVPMNGAQQHPPPPPPPAYHPHPFHYQNGMMHAAPMQSNIMLSQNGGIRYPIPPPPMMANQQKASSRSIKRRTKTGCITCRKRRIKCDESHPTCRNCQKSKRECLGYDPIFKPQTGHAPLQPAPANSTTPSSKSSATPNPYQHTSHSIPGTGGTFVPASNSSQGYDGAYEYASSVDPALSNSDQQGLTMAANSFSTTLRPTRKVKSIAIEQLFSLNDVAPRYHVREAPPPDTLVPPEVRDFYKSHFAQGLDKLFETTWYSTRGLGHLQSDSSLLDFVTQCEEQFRSNDPSATPSIQSLEARLVWLLAVMPRSTFPTRGDETASEQLLRELLPRIDVVEHLLTGQLLPADQKPPPPSIEGHPTGLKYNEQTFWHALGEFTSARDDISDPQHTHAINKALDTMRSILGMMENRDVLYSLAVGRHVGGRMTEFSPHHPLVASNDANDEVSKLEVARRFVEEEDQKGTTQVIQRICGMGIRSWVLQKR